MMATIVQCPNPGCGRVSHLGDDPLGRIFRCPRCLTKLPAAPATAADAGWTAVLGHRPRPDASRSRFGRNWAQSAVVTATGAVRVLGFFGL